MNAGAEQALCAVMADCKTGSHDVHGHALANVAEINPRRR